MTIAPFRSDAPPFTGHRGTAGFVPRSALLHRVYNAGAAALLLGLTLPLIMTIAAALRLKQGPGVIARAPRVGLHQRTFDLLTFRTEPGPQTSVGMIAGDDGFAHYLRETGLDALPQLFNVLRGDMNLVGPRPVRQAAARIEAARDPLYLTRFNVRPGVTGHARAFMCAGTSGRFRAKLTYRLCHAPVRYTAELRVLVRGALVMLRAAVAPLRERLRYETAATRACRLAREAQLVLETPTGIFPVYAISSGTIVVPRQVFDGRGTLLMGTRKGGRRRAAVRLETLNTVNGQKTLRYLPAHENAPYFINRYALRKATLTPRKPKWQRPRLSDLLYEIDLHVHTPAETVSARRWY